MLWWYPIIVLGSFTLSAVLVRVSIFFAHRWHTFDAPDGGRKRQAKPIPRLGGVAVAVAICVMVTLIALVVGQASSLPILAGVLLPALLMALLGFFDDRQPISPWTRLLLQTLIASVAWVFGTRPELFGSQPLNAVVLVLWVVVIVNAVNMLDNSDGLAGATTFVIALFSALIAMVLGQFLLASLAWALVGVAAGFLWHNWHPAKVYLGDAGAYFLGCLLALVVVRLRPEDLSQHWSFLIPLLLLSVPLADLSFVVVSRLSRGVHPFTAGRDHISHRLQNRGLAVPSSVLFMVGACIVSGSIALTLAAL